MDTRQSLGQLRERFDRLLQSPSEELGRGGRFLAYQIRLWWFCGRKLLKDRLQVTASALSYKTLLSLIPVAVIFWMIINAVVPEGDVRQGIRDRVFRALHLKMITYDVGVEGEPDGTEPAAPIAGGEGGAAAGEQDDVSVAANISRMIDSVVSGIQGGGAGITIISVILFVWAGMSIFGTIEGAFNYIYEVRGGRSVFVRFRDFVTTLVLLTLLLGVVTWWQQSHRLPLVRGLTVVISLVASWLLFFIAYKTVPTVRVSTKAALSAALIAGTLWEVGAKTGFVLYLRYATGAGMLYGKLALIPVFMIWIWLSWVIVLFGAELAYVIQHMRALTREQMESDTHSRFLRGDLIALAVAAVAARRFAAGQEPPSRSELSDTVGASEGDVQEVLDALRREGLLRQAERGDGRPGYVPALPPEEISAARVAEVGASIELAPPESGERGNMLRWARAYMGEISGEAAAALSGETLSSLARRSATG